MYVSAVSSQLYLNVTLSRTCDPNSPACCTYTTKLTGSEPVIDLLNILVEVSSLNALKSHCKLVINFTYQTRMLIFTKLEGKDD